MENRTHLLIVEDEPKTLAAVAEAFTLEGWTVDATGDDLAVASLLEIRPPDLIVLDWMLPGRSGLELLQWIRERGRQVPVLMLTARSGIEDRVNGLESGADDYLVKPFAMAELVARCKALLRRPTLGLPEVLRYDDLLLDTRARTARRSDEEIPLTPREVDVLEYLLRHPDEIVTREMLEREVWKQSNRYTSLDNVIDVQMMRLRRKVDAGTGPKLIHTLRGVGYRLGGTAP